MSDLISPSLKADLIGGRRNNSGHPAVGVISANRDFHADHVDLLSYHVGELLGSAALFHLGDLSIPDDAPPPRHGVVELTRRGTHVGSGAPDPRGQIAADSCRVEGVRKAKPPPVTSGGMQVDGARLVESWVNLGVAPMTRRHQSVTRRDDKFK